MESARLVRRTAKGKLTRATRTVTDLMEQGRSPEEITRALQQLKVSYTELASKHDSYCSMLSDDAVFDTEEEWMDECRANMLAMDIAINDYLRAKTQESTIQNELLGLHTSKTRSHDAINTMAASAGNSKDRNQEGVDVLLQRSSPSTQSIADTSHGTESNPTGSYDGNGRISGLGKLRKDFVPKFDGNVRDYGIFRSDFKHVVERVCDERDAMTVLRSSLMGKPAELIRGITNDYNGAWEYLDSVYGDSRYVADAVTQDIASFTCLAAGEDIRFCEFVHLLRRSYATLKELDRAEDMNNNHILALVEQKMCTEDRKVWSRHLVQTEKRATFELLLEWMKKEMEARMRSSAPLRNTVQSGDSGHNVCHVASSDCVTTTTIARDRCWICHSSDHWIDQCEILQSLTPQQRLRRIQDNYACQCCLKLAGNNHTPATCYRRRRCSVMVSDTEQCDTYHHPLLHDAIATVTDRCSVGVVSHPRHTAVLPILSVRALGRDAHSHVTNALFDSGAQISLIRTDLAEKLGLQGRNVSFTLNKVGGEEEVMDTKEYSVRIQSLANSKPYTLNLIGIPCINGHVDEIIGLNDVAKKLNIEKTHFNREKSGAVGILIGIDHAHLHIGETRSDTSGMVARHTALGWVLFGTRSQSQSMNSVLHMSVNTPGCVSAKENRHEISTERMKKACTDDGPLLKQHFQDGKRHRRGTGHKRDQRNVKYSLKTKSDTTELATELTQIQAKRKMRKSTDELSFSTPNVQVGVPGKVSKPQDRHSGGGINDTSSITGQSTQPRTYPITNTDVCIQFQQVDKAVAATPSRQTVKNVQIMDSVKELRTLVRTTTKYRTCHMNVNDDNLDNFERTYDIHCNLFTQVDRTSDYNTKANDSVRYTGEPCVYMFRQEQPIWSPCFIVHQAAINRNL